MLEVKNITKHFDDVAAVNNISFNVDEGRIFGLLGPNGAGKTTILRIILSIIKMSSGEVIYSSDNKDKSIRKIVGYLPEERGLYKKNKVLDVLIYFAMLKSLSKKAAKEKAYYWLDRLQIADYANRWIEELSKGNQQKVQFIATVIHNPSILILDEPFSGFDPLNQNLIKEIISEFVDSKKIVILSTHMMEIAENFCSDILLIDHGKKILEGTLNNIKQKYSQNSYLIKFNGNISRLDDINFLTILEHERNNAVIKVEDNLKASTLLDLISGKLEIYHFQKIEPTLNDIFIDALNESRQT